MTDDPTPFDDDLEAAYRRALEAVDAADLPPFSPAGEADDADGPDLLPFPVPRDEPAPERPARAAARRDEARSAPAPTAEPPRVTPQQVLEAALFVGGVELSAERLAGLLKGEHTPEYVTRTLDDLDRRYAAENRPYAVRCEEGAYRLALRDEYEPLRRRVYGLGPKEVRLSAEAIEVLSLVAYRQPLSRDDAEAAKPGAGNVLRQLVRRQLVAVERDGDEPRYVTTPRFLDAFGIASLDELPRAEDLSFK